jgi:hypothetical protein
VFHTTKRERHTNNWTSSTRKYTLLSEEFNKGESNCTAGACWIDFWGKCYAVRQPKISAEKLSAVVAWFVECSELLQAVMKK